jgi:hypothetical protein
MMILQELVSELRKHVVFKETTSPGDLVLVATDNPRMLVYALIEAIDPDPSRKDSWWHVTMHLLTVPPQVIVWTLREPQFTGREIFTMGGDARFMQAVRLGEKPTGIDRGDAGIEDKTAPMQSFRRVK